MRVRMGLAALALTGAGFAYGPGEAQAQKRQRDVISREELATSAQKHQDAFAAVRSLRPHFLNPPRSRSLGGTGPAPLMIYVDGNFFGELDALKNLMTADVDEIRYLDANRAQNQFGISHNGGALMIKLWKAPKENIERPPPPED